MESRCPICDNLIKTESLERHVNVCLDNQEANSSAVANKSSLYGEADGDENNESITVGNRAVNHFTALGLRMDSSNKKKRMSEIKKNQKDKPTLTSILIAEKRLQRYEKKTRIPKDEGSLEISEYRQDQLNKEDERNESKEYTFLDNVKIKNDNILKKRIEPEISSQSVKNNDIETKTNNDASQRSKELVKLRRESSIPLAQRVRPKTLEDFYGQSHLLGTNGLLRNVINSESIPSFILWGSPGVGKTSLARIISATSNYKFVEVSGSEGNTKALREVFKNAENEKRLTGAKTILFLDEIHRFNKAVQDLLLPVIEKGIITVIGATTENPSFSLNNALLSRMHTFTMKPLPDDAIAKILFKGLYHINRTRKYIYGLHHIALKRDAAEYIARLSTGDSRVALNILESIHAYLSHSQFSRFENYDRAIKPEKSGVIILSAELLKPLLSTKNYHQMYDRHGDMHYDTISAFHKSIRGSDADSAIFYLTKMLAGGEDPLFIARRMIVIASEDIGLRDSSALPFAIATKEAIEFVGMPEGEIILAHCTIKLARAPKSTKSYRALRTAQALLKENPEIKAIPIPLHLRNAPTRLMKEMGYGEKYKYNPEFKYGKVKQTYLPNEIKDEKFIDQVHLGNITDVEIDREELRKAEQEGKDYVKFKDFKRQKLKEEHARVVEESKLNSERRTRVSKIKQKVTERKSKEYNNMSQSKGGINSLSEGQFARIYSYDEFLNKEDQPDYFDGNEKDQYSDDPDCTNNFERSYDEFLDKEMQPEYFEGDSCTDHYVSEHPIFSNI